MLRLKNFFWFPDILADLHSHLKKKAEICNFYLKFLQILNFQMWIFGRKFGRSAENFGQKYSSDLYSDQNNFELNTIITRVSNVKKPYTPLKRVWEGGSVLLVTYPSNHLTWWQSILGHDLPRKRHFFYLLLKFLSCDDNAYGRRHYGTKYTHRPNFQPIGHACRS